MECLATTQQKKAEIHIIGESMYDHTFLDALNKEDFLFYRKEFEAIKECKGNQMQLITKHPNFYQIQDSIVFLSLRIDTLILYLLESTFKRFLSEVITFSIKNYTNKLDNALYVDLESKSKKEDIFDLINYLPDYLDNLGVKNEKLQKWSEYCQKRISGAKKYFDK